METSHVAGTASETPTPAQYKEFFSQVDRGIITKNRLQDFLRGTGSKKRRSSSHHSDFALARDVLGDDFFGPEERTSLHGMDYDPAYVAFLRNSVPPKETLKLLHEEKFILIAGPSASLSAKEIYCRDPALFDEYSKTVLTDKRVLYCEPTGAIKEVAVQVNPGWLALCKVLSSQVSTFGDILALTCNGHKGNAVYRSAPNIAQAMWGFGIYKQLRNISCIPEGIRFVTASVQDCFDGEGPSFANIAITAKKDDGRLHVTRTSRHYVEEESHRGNFSAFVF